MLRPSYTELMEKLNREQNVDIKITSRYTIVIAAAKRARQIIDGAVPHTTADSDKAVSFAVNELNEGLLNIITVQDDDDDKDIYDSHGDETGDSENIGPSTVDYEFF